MSGLLNKTGAVSGILGTTVGTVTAADLSGVLPVGVTGGSGLTALGTVVSVAVQTFIFNDKFSFNGFGGAAYTEPMDTNVEQLAIAQQGGTYQRYQYIPLDTDVDCDIHVTFIDQNNA